VGSSGWARWHADAREYAAAAEQCPAGAVPALLPRSERKTALWQQVTADHFDQPAEAAPGLRLVVAWGTDSHVPATVFAGQSGSRMITCSSADEACHQITGAPESYVVLIAAADLLTVAVLARLSAVSGSAGKSLGVLSGRGEPELSFSVAKALLRPKVSLTGIDLFDAPDHRDTANLGRLPPELAAALTKPTLAKILRAHGEGGHAKLPGVVVCGLLDATEFTDYPDAGCRRHPRNCKRADKARSTVLFADELAAPVIAFVCCNGFNVAGELYPSPVSMALSFAEGWTSALIAPVRPLIAPDDMIEVLHHGLAAGTHLGPLVQDLNALSTRIGQRDPFILHGDPYMSLPAQPVPPAPSAPDTVAVSEMLDWLVRALRHADRARRVMRSADAWLGGQAEQELARPHTTVNDTERLLLHTMKGAEAGPSAESLRRLQRTLPLIRMRIARWDQDMTRLMLAGREVFDAYDLGHYDQALDEVRPGSPCLRCGTPTEVYVYGAGEGARDQRLAESCWVCGPVSEHRHDGLALRVTESTRAGRSGQSFVLRADVTVPAEQPPLVGSIHLLLRSYDKAKGGCTYEEARLIPAEKQTVEFRFPLPPGLGADLHSVRLSAASGFDIAYARTRFAGLPGCAEPEFFTLGAASTVYGGTRRAGRSPWRRTRSDQGFQGGRA
jgi:hypothetical protein